MNNSSVLGILILGLLSLISPAYAQSGQPAEEPSQNLEMLFDPQQGAGELSTIKAQIQSLLEQNKALESQLEPVKKEFWDLREKLHSARAQSELQKQLTAEEAKKEQERRQQLTRTQSLQQLQLYDLQYQKKELELELRLRKLLAAQQQKDEQGRLAALREELERNIEVHKDVRAQINELKDRNRPQTSQIQTLKQHNAALKDQIKSRQPAVNSVHVENASGPAGALWKNIRQKEQEKARLQNVIEELKAAQVSPNASVEGNFVDGIRHLDGENQRLRSRLFSLRQRVAAP